MKHDIPVKVENDLRFLATSELVRVQGFDFAKDKIAEEFVRLVGEAVANDRTYPLFDAATNKLIRRNIESKHIEPSAWGREGGKEVGLAADLLQRLPLFPQSSLQEVVAIRNELDKPLIFFRAKMVEFAEAIKNAQWDRDFPFDAERVFVRHIKPAVEEIETIVKSNNLIKELVPKVATSTIAVNSGTFLGATIAQLSHWPALAAVSLGVGAVASVGLAINEVSKLWREKQVKIEQNYINFYRLAGQRLTQPKQ